MGNDGPVMKMLTRPWLPILAYCVCAACLLAANEDSYKKPAGQKPAAKETPKPTPAPVAKPATPAPKPAAAAPARTSSIRRPPVRKPSVTRRTTPPVTVTASPEPAAPPAPSTAVIHLVTHSAGNASGNEFPIPADVAKFMEENDRAERARAEWARVERERQEMERKLAERERAVAVREAAVREPEPETEPSTPQPPPKRRVDRNLLTNEGLVKLADAGYDEVFLMELIRRKPAKFDTTIEGLSYLMRAGLSQQLVRTVLAVEEWERARRSEEMANVAPPPMSGGNVPTPPVSIPAGMKEIRQKVMVPDGQLRAGERGMMVLAPSGERWYWVPDAANR